MTVELKSSKKPPLGIMPRGIWIEKRIFEIDEAIQRRLGTSHKIFPEWIEERNELMDLLSILPNENIGEEY